MNESVAGRSERDELSPLRPRWEWSADEIKRIGRVVGMIAEHLTTLPEKPVFRPFPAELAAKYLDSKPPELRRRTTFWPLLRGTSNRTLSETPIRALTGG
jgi:hypothetical protein